MSVNNTTSIAAQDPSVPVITNLEIQVGDVGNEVSHTMQPLVKAVEIVARGGAVIQFSFTSGESSTKFKTIPKYSNWYKDHIKLSGYTIYMTCDKVDVIEITEWI